MYFIVKLTVVILILYLKLNGLNAIPSIGPHKMSLTAAASAAAAITTAEATTSNLITAESSSSGGGGGDFGDGQKSNNEILTVTKTTTTNRTIKTINALKAKTKNQLPAVLQSTQNQQKKTKNQIFNDGILFNTLANINKNKNNKSSYQQNYLFYNISEHSTQQKSDLILRSAVVTVAVAASPSSSTSTLTKTPTKPPYVKELLPFDSKSSKQNGDDDVDADASGELDLGNILVNTFNKSDVNRFLIKYDSDDGNHCLLNMIKDRLMWWSHKNGTLRGDALFNFATRTSYLDLSYRNINEDNRLFSKTLAFTYWHGMDIIAFSAAENNLTHAPYRTLSALNKTLKYLTLKGNRFEAYTTEMQKDEEGIAWATFPPMPALLELDISNCHIEFITRDAFRNLSNLRRLFASHNKMLTIPSDSFHHLKSLHYLDLSFTNVLNSDFQIPQPTLEAVHNLIYGVKIQQKTFQVLPKLIYLDLSYTKLTRNSAMAFTHLGEKLRYLSLCYTSFPMVGNALFKNTALVGLDLSGNPYAAQNMIEDAFEGVSDTLKYLYFERSNIKDLTWLHYLRNLRVLGLAGNNINTVSLEVFNPLHSLQLLDLSSNYIGNWYNRVFTQNEQLRVLNLRDNNINIITTEMLRDFQVLEYLSLGDNNFVCDCLLRDLVDIAAANNKDAACSRNVLQEATEILIDTAYLIEDYLTSNVKLVAKQRLQALYARRRVPITFDMSQLLLQRHMPKLQHSYKNMQQLNRQNPKVRYATTQYYNKLKAQRNTDERCSAKESILVHMKVNSSSFKFQLLDYEVEHYWCFNETERLNFMQLNCQSRINDELTKQLHTLTKFVVGCVVTFFGVSLMAVLIYLKRWHIHYYFSYLKSAALVSVAAKENADQLNALAETDPNLVYDIFISYCQSDRQWVFDELLPNVEESGDISICMHERDFQIGLTILDNIVSCMDRSRTLMLVISSNFLLSHWCQFEMHIAQHRIFEMSKEHLILVFLEDIPRNKRPKTLQYLMEVKTYIKWPSASRSGNRQPNADERKFFWKRLKRSLENIGLRPYPKAKARESHA